MSEPLRAAVYARVSSAGQRDRHTIESQLRDVPAYCAAQGRLRVAPVVTGRLRVALPMRVAA